MEKQQINTADIRGNPKYAGFIDNLSEQISTIVKSRIETEFGGEDVSAIIAGLMASAGGTRTMITAIAQASGDGELADRLRVYMAAELVFDIRTDRFDETPDETK